MFGQSTGGFGAQPAVGGGLFGGGAATTTAAGSMFGATSAAPSFGQTSEYTRVAQASGSISSKCER